jgi:AcrR family transcriptional regulator
MHMEKAARKERKLAQREGLFLDIARRMFLSDGYHGFTMARVAEAAGYSKGTVYQHFSCKEEIILALVLRGLERRVAIMEQAAAFRGNPRERLVAVGEGIDLFARLYPDDLRIFYISNTEAITQKVSEQSLWKLRRLTQRTFRLVSGIIRDAIERGDLSLPEGVTPEHLAYAMRATSDGAYAIAQSWMPAREMGIAEPFAAVKQAIEVMSNGFGWRPLSTEWDYAETRRRVWEEIFPGEVGQAAAH